MKLSQIILSVLAAGILAGVPLAGRSTAARPGDAAPDAAQVERGRYLVTIMGCNDCHTPFKMGERGPEPDLARLLSGHPADLAMPPAPDLGQGPWVWVGAGTNTAFAGPWGVSFAANLTPDRQTGVGAWSAETFRQAMRTGRHEGQGRPILPPMPTPGIGAATDDDLDAIFAYLQSVPPLKNRVPQPVEPAVRP